jgi:hypothetical protein
MSGLSPATDGLRLETKTRESMEGTPSSIPRILRPLSPGLSETDTSWDTPDLPSAVPRGVEATASPLRPVPLGSSRRSAIGMSRQRPSRGASSLPPSIQLTPRVKHTYRYSNTASTVKSVTVADLFGAIGTIGIATNSSVQPWASSFKLATLHVWPASSSSSASNVVVEWAAGSVAQVPDDARDVTLPEGITVSRGLSFTPPPQSLAGFWITDTDASSVMFAIQAPVGSVVDLVVHYTLSNVFVPAPIAAATVSIGTPYYLALDGASSNTYIPLGLPTTH